MSDPLPAHAFFKSNLYSVPPLFKPDPASTPLSTTLAKHAAFIHSGDSNSPLVELNPDDNAQFTGEFEHSSAFEVEVDVSAISTTQLPIPSHFFPPQVDVLPSYTGFDRNEHRDLNQDVILENHNLFEIDTNIPLIPLEFAPTTSAATLNPTHTHTNPSPQQFNFLTETIQVFDIFYLIRNGLTAQFSQQLTHLQLQYGGDAVHAYLNIKNNIATTPLALSIITNRFNITQLILHHASLQYTRPIETLEALLNAPEGTTPDDDENADEDQDQDRDSQSRGDRSDDLIKPANATGQVVVDINAEDTYGMIALLHAAHKGNILPLFSLLLQEETLWNEVDRTQKTVLHYLAIRNHSHVLKFLHKLITLCSPTTPESIASPSNLQHHSHLNTIKQRLYQRLYDIIYLQQSMVDVNGMTPLMYAIENTIHADAEVELGSDEADREITAFLAYLDNSNNTTYQSTQETLRKSETTFAHQLLELQYQLQLNQFASILSTFFTALSALSSHPHPSPPQSPTQVLSPPFQELIQSSFVLPIISAINDDPIFARDCHLSDAFVFCVRTHNRAILSTLSSYSLNLFHSILSLFSKAILASSLFSGNADPLTSSLPSLLYHTLLSIISPYLFHLLRHYHDSKVNLLMVSAQERITPIFAHLYPRFAAQFHLLTAFFTINTVPRSNSKHTRDCTITPDELSFFTLSAATHPTNYVSTISSFLVNASNHTHVENTKSLFETGRRSGTIPPTTTPFSTTAQFNILRHFPFTHLIPVISGPTHPIFHLDSQQRSILHHITRVFQFTELNSMEKLVAVAQTVPESSPAAPHSPPNSLPTSFLTHFQHLGSPLQIVFLIILAASVVPPRPTPPHTSSPQPRASIHSPHYHQSILDLIALRDNDGANYILSLAAHGAWDTIKFLYYLSTSPSQLFHSLPQLITTYSIAMSTITTTTLNGLMLYTSDYNFHNCTFYAVQSHNTEVVQHLSATLSIPLSKHALISQFSSIPNPYLTRALALIDHLSNNGSEGNKELKAQLLNLVEKFRNTSNTILEAPLPSTPSSPQATTSLSKSDFKLSPNSTIYSLHLEELIDPLLNPSHQVNTLLHTMSYAVNARLVDIALVLVKHGADINIRDPVTGNSLFMIAIESNNTELINFLLSTLKVYKKSQSLMKIKPEIGPLHSLLDVFVDEQGVKSVSQSGSQYVPIPTSIQNSTKHQGSKISADVMNPIHHVLDLSVLNYEGWSCLTMCVATGNIILFRTLLRLMKNVINSPILAMVHPVNKQLTVRDTRTGTNLSQAVEGKQLPASSSTTTTTTPTTTTASPIHSHSPDKLSKLNDANNLALLFSTTHLSFCLVVLCEAAFAPPYNPLLNPLAEKGQKAPQTSRDIFSTLFPSHPLASLTAPQPSCHSQPYIITIRQQLLHQMYYSSITAPASHHSSTSLPSHTQMQTFNAFVELVKELLVVDPYSTLILDGAVIGVADLNIHNTLTHDAGLGMFGQSRGGVSHPIALRGDSARIHMLHPNPLLPHLFPSSNQSQTVADSNTPKIFTNPSAYDNDVLAHITPNVAFKHHLPPIISATINSNNNIILLHILLSAGCDLDITDSLYFYTQSLQHHVSSSTGAASNTPNTPNTADTNARKQPRNHNPSSRSLHHPTTAQPRHAKPLFTGNNAYHYAAMLGFTNVLQLFFEYTENHAITLPTQDTSHSRSFYKTPFNFYTLDDGEVKTEAQLQSTSNPAHHSVSLYGKLSAGAGLFRRNDQGLLPIHLAIIFGHFEAFKLLLPFYSTYILSQPVPINILLFSPFDTIKDAHNNNSIPTPSTTPSDSLSDVLSAHPSTLLSLLDFAILGPLFQTFVLFGKFFQDTLGTKFSLSAHHLDFLSSTHLPRFGDHDTHRFKQLENCSALQSYVAENAAITSLNTLLHLRHQSQTTYLDFLLSTLDDQAHPKNTRQGNKTMSELRSESDDLLSSYPSPYNYTIVKLIQTLFAKLPLSALFPSIFQIQFQQRFLAKRHGLDVIHSSIQSGHFGTLDDDEIERLNQGKSNPWAQHGSTSHLTKPKSASAYLFTQSQQNALNASAIAQSTSLHKFPNNSQLPPIYINNAFRYAILTLNDALLFWLVSFFASKATSLNKKDLSEYDQFDTSYSSPGNIHYVSVTLATSNDSVVYCEVQTIFHLLFELASIGLSSLLPPITSEPKSKSDLFHGGDWESESTTHLRELKQKHDFTSLIPRAQFPSLTPSPSRPSSSSLSTSPRSPTPSHETSTQQSLTFIRMLIHFISYLKANQTSYIPDESVHKLVSASTTSTTADQHDLIQPTDPVILVPSALAHSHPPPSSLSSNSTAPQSSMRSHPFHIHSPLIIHPSPSRDQPSSAFTTSTTPTPHNPTYRPLSVLSLITKFNLPIILVLLYNSTPSLITAQLSLGASINESMRRSSISQQVTSGASSDSTEAQPRLSQRQEAHLAAFKASSQLFSRQLTLSFENLTYIDSYGRNCLHYASISGATQALQLLLAAHIFFTDVSNTSRSTSSNAISPQKLTQIYQLYNQSIQQPGRTPLSTPLRELYDSVVTKNWKKHTFYTLDNYGFDPLCYALIYGQYHVFLMYIEHGYTFLTASQIRLYSTGEFSRQKSLALAAVDIEHKQLKSQTSISHALDTEARPTSPIPLSTTLHSNSLTFSLIVAYLIAYSRYLSICNREDEINTQLLNATANRIPTQQYEQALEACGTLKQNYESCLELARGFAPHLFISSLSQQPAFPSSPKASIDDGTSLISQLSNLTSNLATFQTSLSSFSQPSLDVIYIVAFWTINQNARYTRLPTPTPQASTFSYSSLILPWFELNAMGFFSE